MLAVSCYKCEATLSLFLTAQWQRRVSKELSVLHPVNHYSYIRASDSDEGKTSNSMHSLLPASKHYTGAQLPHLPTFSTSQRLGVQVFETTLATDLIGLQGQASYMESKPVLWLICYLCPTKTRQYFAKTVSCGIIAM